MKALTKLSSNPHTLIKKIIFYHTYLQKSKKIDEKYSLNYMNKLLDECGHMIN